ncbi:MAG: SEC-C metal-binding domain-containing protein [Thermoanaerobaculia bacterium]
MRDSSQRVLAFVRPGAAETEWAGGRYFPNAEVREGSAVIRPEMILWVEPSGPIVGITLVNPLEPVSATQSLAATMDAPLEGPPRRPHRIRVADETMAAELRASYPDLAVVVAPVPEVDAVFEEIRPGLESQGNESSYFGDGDVSTDALGHLFQTASLLFRTAPWRYATEEQLLRVDIPRFGIEGACLCVIGEAGESRGILLFRSLDDFERFAESGGRALEGEDLADGGQRVVTLRSLSFDRKRDLPRAMVAEVERHRWAVAGANAYPVLYCLGPSFTPLEISEEDVRIITVCVRALLAFLVLHRDWFELGSFANVRESSRGEDDVEVVLTGPYARTGEAGELRGVASGQWSVVSETSDSLPRKSLITGPTPPPGPQQPHIPKPQVGRNDPCPCGSGKKYKKCHLEADSLAARDARVESVHDLDHRLAMEVAVFASRNFGPARFPKAVEAGEEAAPLVIPWTIWTATIDGQRIADAFLERNGARLSADEREWFEAQRNAWLSVFEVTRVAPGTIDVRDLLTGEERTVRDELASRTLVVRDVVHARIVDHRSATYFGGMFGRALAPIAAAYVVDEIRMKLRLLKKAVPSDRLREFKTGAFLIERWAAAVRTEEDRRAKPPRLTNTDGDPLSFVTDSFRFDPAHRVEVERRLAALEGAAPADSNEQETGIAIVRAADDTVLGRLVVASGLLRIETNSTQRANALRRTVKKALQGMLSGESRERNRPSIPLRGPASVGPPQTPEQAAVAREYKEHHYEQWIDVPLPALGGQTPRQATRTAPGRRRLDLILRQLENAEQQQPEASRFDVRRLRAALRLDD